MIKIYPYENLGHANHGWLDARHHFSFARYHNPARISFGDLRVINDDKVAPHTGFSTHPHNNMEIITYVRQGAITHEDSMGNIGKTAAGDVQVMSAGSGVFHSEHNRENEDTKLYQIWVEPNKTNVKPRWEAREFPKEFVNNNAELPVLVSGRDEDTHKNALFIYSNCAIYAGNIKAGNETENKIKYQAYILASSGEFTVNGVKMKKGDGAEITNEKIIKIAAISDAEILIIDVPNN
jgi:redox-sensitive bicupin YhaK (pirin superfamily)